MHQRRFAVPLAALAALGLCGLAEAAPARRRATFGKTERGPGAASGFKLEGPPKLVSLFGDTTTFTHDVDHYLALYESMQRVRDDFSRAVQTAIAELAAHQAAAGPAGTRTCPVERVALPYALSFHLGEDFRRSSGELGRVFAAIRDLDQLGETAGLTPDYRWKVRRVLTLHKSVGIDWREMQAFFQEHLGKELAFFGCDPDALMARGEAAGAAALAKAAERPAPTLQPPTTAKSVAAAKKAKAEAPPPVAATVTFTVDNTSCPGALAVFLDGQPLGKVSGSERGAFAALVGPHDLCLIPDGSPQRCGDLGTVRRTYLHQGWAIQLRCN